MVGKIFVIGFHRTGTRTIASCISECGYKIIHYPHPPRDPYIFDDLLTHTRHWKTLSSCDGIADIVTVPHFKDLDVLYPGSKFILSLRQLDEWSESAVRHLDRVYNNAFGHTAERHTFDETMHHMLYGNRTSKEEIKERHLAHLNDVYRYFRGTNKLLAINIFANNSTKRLSEFLNIDCRKEFEIKKDRF